MSLEDGEPSCPQNYPVRHVFYSGFSDTRACTPCTCSPPLGSECDAVLTNYTDAACTTELRGGLIELDASLCNDVASGPLQSMSATMVANQPGSCEPSGGVPAGEAAPAGPSTFCCQG